MTIHDPSIEGENGEHRCTTWTPPPAPPGPTSAAVDVLYTSLLLQATAGVASARPAAAAPLAASQVAAFRRSWLLAFAHRIGERLEQASAQVVAEAESAHGGSLALVLVSRAKAAEAAMRSAAPRTGRLSVTASSAEGRAAGRAAADRATLAGQAPLPARPRALGR